jgi:lipopolysaccharide export system protein LptA
MSRARVIVLALLLALTPVAAHAAGAATAKSAGASPAATEKVVVTGDHFVVDDARHQATFSGNVVVEETGITLKANQVVGLYGASGPSSISSFEATGNVVLITPDQQATGDKAVFDPKTRLLTLTGNVVVTSKSGQVQSTRLVVDLRTKKSTFSAGGGGRVTGVFTSE